MNMLRRPVLLGSALLAAACGTNGPSVAPSALGTAAPFRLGATAAPATQHDHTAATTISIVSSAGPAAFLPNPLQAAVGSTLVWMNSDLVAHNIVLADGTPIGNIGPGETSAPVMMSTPSLAYHCTIHPTMTGIIADPSVVMPDPPPPPTDYYPSPDPDDGYYDY